MAATSSHYASSFGCDQAEMLNAFNKSQQGGEAKCRQVNLCNTGAEGESEKCKKKQPQLERKLRNAESLG